MKLLSVGVIEIPKDVQDEGYDHVDYYDWHDDKLEALEKTSDLIKVTLKDGTSLLTAKINFNAGTCGCCIKFSKSDVVKYEGFKVTE